MGSKKHHHHHHHHHSKHHHERHHRHGERSQGSNNANAAAFLQSAARGFVARRTLPRSALVARLEAYARWTPETFFAAYLRRSL